MIYKSAKNSKRVARIIRSVIKKADDALKKAGLPCNKFADCVPGEIVDKLIDSAKSLGVKNGDDISSFANLSSK